MITKPLLTAPVTKLTTLALLALMSLAGGAAYGEDDVVEVRATDLRYEGTGFYAQKKEGWLAVHPEEQQSAVIRFDAPVEPGVYDIRLKAVGESDGRSIFQLGVDGEDVGQFQPPLSDLSYEEGRAFDGEWKGVRIGEDAQIELRATANSIDGLEYARARWAGLEFRPSRQKDGAGEVTLNRQLVQWQPVTLSLKGPWASEADRAPNPFLGYRMTVVFEHESGEPSYRVPGYFAADGVAAHSSAEAGNVWRAHLSPDKAGEWRYRIEFVTGEEVTVSEEAGEPLAPYHGKQGKFTVRAAPEDAPGFYAEGRLEYVGERYLRFAGSGRYFLKAGPDSPETMLGYADFDNTEARKENVPLKKWLPHFQDWKQGDPVWQGHKGKGLIGAVNYLSRKGANAMSFLVYSAGGDGENVWPHVSYINKLAFDASKLDQWNIVFEHAQRRGVYLHFKMQETENDDERTVTGKPVEMPHALDGGKTEVERKLFYRELVARFGHHLALNWNFGEENSQTTEEQLAMASYLGSIDPYQHLRVIHTYPNQQEKVYEPLLGQEEYTGASLQNHWNRVHELTLKWIEASQQSGHAWVVANDEQGSYRFGAPPMAGYDGFEGFVEEGAGAYDLNEVRKYTLWGNLMAGGAGVEYYFGYHLPENDLVAENYASRDILWDFSRIALEFFREHELPIQEMENADALVGNPERENGNWCLAKEGSVYVVYLPKGGSVELDLSDAGRGVYTVEWYDPRNGGELQRGDVRKVSGGKKVKLGKAPQLPNLDWVVLVRKE